MKKDSFVYAKVNIVADNNVNIEKMDVGICLEIFEEYCSVFFIRQWKKARVKCSQVTTFDEKRSGDGFKKKICNVCHKLKDTVKFDRNQNGVGNRIIRRPSCKSCRVQMDGTSISAADKRKWSKTKPTRVPFECPVCEKRTIAGVTSKVVLEHDHLTGKVRGWVCDSCNTGLGRFKDDRVFLERAIKFLEGK